MAASAGIKGRFSTTTSTAAPIKTNVCTRDHPRYSGSLTMSAARHHGALMIARDAQLENAERGDEKQQREKRDDAQVHWRSRNSALKPGPKAAASAMSPGLSGRLSSHS